MHIKFAIIFIFGCKTKCTLNGQYICCLFPMYASFVFYLDFFFLFFAYFVCLLSFSIHMFVSRPVPLLSLSRSLALCFSLPPSLSSLSRFFIKSLHFSWDRFVVTVIVYFIVCCITFYCCLKSKCFFKLLLSFEMGLIYIFLFLYKWEWVNVDVDLNLCVCVYVCMWVVIWCHLIVELHFLWAYDINVRKPKHTIKSSIYFTMSAYFNILMKSIQ